MTSLFPVTFDTSFRTKEESSEELSPPSGFCLTSDGNFLLADDFNHRIQVYDPEFHPINSFGEKGKELGQLQYPKGIAIDKIGDIKKSKIISKAQSFVSYPSVERDLAIQISTDIPYEDIKQLICNNSGTLLKSITLFDLYNGKDIPEDSHSLGLSLKFSSSKRTLNDVEIDNIMNKIINQLKDKFNVIQR